jgi:hypothetical protein
VSAGFDFVASPFSHADAAVEERRYHDALDFVAWSLASGMVVFSPIAHSVALARRALLRTDHGFWLQANMAMLASARSLIVLALPGWEESLGVRAEILEAHRLRLPLAFYERHGAAWWRPQATFDAGGWSP